MSFHSLKELYTSISTLAQKLVLTLLNNEFILEILISTLFRQKIREHFRLKNHKVKFPANLVVLWLYCSYTKFHIFEFYTFLYFYTKTLGPL